MKADSLKLAVALLMFGSPAAAQAPERAALLIRIDSVVEAEMKKAKVPGMSVAVQRGGDVLLAKGYGIADLEHGVPATVETVYRIGSITKQFTATATMRLVEQGKVGLQDEITKYLPNYPTQGHKVTIHHLLTHTSGIKSYTSLGPKFWGEAALHDLDDEKMLELFKNEPFDFDPGAKYLYNNSAYYLLGVVIKQVTGMPYADYVKKTIFEPLGLRNTLYCDERPIVPHRAQGYEVRDGQMVNDGPISMNTPGAAGALCSNVLDLLAWQRAFNADRLVNAASRRLMTTKTTLTDKSETSYGYGLGLGDLEGHRSIAHGGGINGFISQLSHFPDDSLTVVVLGNTGSAPSSRVASTIARLVLGLPLPKPKDLATTAEERSRVVGIYEIMGQKVHVTERNGALMIQLPGDQPTRLLSQGEGRYVPESDPEHEVSFTASEIVLKIEGQTLRGKRT
jgi:D-alanyl-D-alanine carboxypeptidase